MTKKDFRSLLGECSYDDQPVLAMSDFWRTISLVATPHWDEVESGRAFPSDQRRRIAVTRSGEKLRTEFRRYNKWLDRWYIENSPGNHLSRQGEHMTQLRASGFTEEQVWKYCAKETP